MAEQIPQVPGTGAGAWTGDPGTPVPPTGGPATPPSLLVPVVLLTLGRIVVFAALYALLWLCGLAGAPGFLFALLLSMPVSYVLLRPLRDRVTEGLAARSATRRTGKEQLRAQLRGDEPPLG